MSGEGKVDLRTLAGAEAQYQETCRIDQANLGLLGVEVNLNCEALKLPEGATPASVGRGHDAATRRIQQTIKAMRVSKA